MTDTTDLAALSPLEHWQALTEACQCSEGKGFSGDLMRPELLALDKERLVDIMFALCDDWVDYLNKEEDE